MRIKPFAQAGNDRGTVLVASLLVLVAVATIVAGVSVTTMVEKSVTVNHRVANRALYAADSGVEAARQLMTTYARGKLDSLNASWAGNGAIIPDPANLFPGSGLTLNSAGTPAFNTVSTLVFEDSTLDLQSQAYNYRYTITSNGSYNGSARQVISEGRLRVSATRGSFADYLIFTDTHLVPGGSPIWFHTSGHFDGRVHTNDQFRFAYFPTFEDHVTSVNGKAVYYNDGYPTELDTDFNGTKDVPDFFGGFSRGVPKIDLPENSFSQERAALGGNPADTSPLTNADRRAALGLPSGSTSPPTGVYLPNSGGYVTGGIYISGDAQKVEMSVDSGNQVMTIRDDNGQTSVITVDHSNDITKVVDPGGGTTYYNGVPRGVTYARGNIDDLGGPNRSGSTVVPAISSQHQMTVVATQDIVVRSDLAVDDFNSSQGVLGIFTSGGDVRIGTDAPDELVMDAFVMASDDTKVFTVDSYDSGSYRGQVHLRGGMITNYYGAFGTFGYYGMTGYGRDFKYDRRGYVPPFFPLTQRFTTDDPQPQVLAWREN